MDRWALIIATLFAAIGGVNGMLSLRHGHRSKATIFWMAGALAGQLVFLYLRGQERAACPLMGTGEILVFLAWSLTLFYLLVGTTYRLSLLGVFSAPVVVVFQIIALIPGVLDPTPERLPETDAWRETHAAMSVLAYGALALASVAAVMFLVLNRQLKTHHLASGLFKNLPPVRELLISLKRLLWLGWLTLSVGVVAGVRMPRSEGAEAHLVVAAGVWLAYTILLGVLQLRGITGKRLSLVTVILFVVSLSVFASV
ncbi:cytochrome c biogenesis protein CcsA [Haloferula sargassicola]|uniref:Cytochrome c assembly protein domain-containing protein n=1 Tax=Haloferula sargassicola TaxID=490096 RepID=A0ABP9UPA4_9BACT